MGALATKVLLGTSRGGADSVSGGAGAGAGAGGAGAGHVGAHLGGGARAASNESLSTLSAAMDRVVEATLEFGPTRDMDELVARRAESMDLDTALKTAAAPEEVVSMLRQRGRLGQPADGAGETVRVTLNETMVDRALLEMNNILSDAQQRLDEKVVECRTRKEEAWAAKKSAARDVYYFSSQVSSKARIITTTLGSIEQADRGLQSIKEDILRTNQSFRRNRALVDAQRRQRLRDLNSSQFMLNLTRCPDASLLQRGAGSGFASRRDGTAMRGIRACVNKSMGSGKYRFDLQFHDPKLQHSVDSMTEEGRQKLQLALSRAELLAGPNASTALHKMGLAVGHGLVDDLEDGNEDGPLPGEEGSGSGLSLIAVLGPPSNAPDLNSFAYDQANKCIALEPDCGLLHDTFAALWGEMKDLADAADRRIFKDDLIFKKYTENLRGQLQALSEQKSVAQQTLAEVTADNARLTEQQGIKQREMKGIEAYTARTQANCKEVITYILLEQICAAVKVRNELLVGNVPNLRASDIVDCKVSRWIPGACSVKCDDTLQGGTMDLHREIVVMNSTWGVGCPRLDFPVVCNKVRCPVDCQLSEWSTFTTCSQECGGGLRFRTRQVQTKARYGGMPCDSTQESQPCNTGSCDRDCVLGGWSPFSDCTKACDSGSRQRTKPVLVPSRGRGKCPKDAAPSRYQQVPCNTKKCYGDEVCATQADIVIAVDGSGSITARGFEVFKTFAAKLVRRLQPEVYGNPGIRVGVVQYGNGQVSSSWVVSDALVIVEPTFEIEDAARRVEAMTWQSGLTNMAQASEKALNLLRGYGRQGVASVVVFITDGRPTFKRQTLNAIQDLKKMAQVNIVHVQAFRKPTSTWTLQSYASVPVATTYKHIPGKRALEGLYDYWTTNVLAMTCPTAESPTFLAEQARQRGFQKSLEGKFCGQSTLTRREDSIDECYLFARSQQGGFRSFAYGIRQCIVYTEPCPEYTRNSTYNVYVPYQPNATSGTSFLRRSSWRSSPNVSKR